MDRIPTRNQWLGSEVSRLKAEVAELRARNEALEKENTLLSLMGAEAADRVQPLARKRKRAWA